MGVGTVGVRWSQLTNHLQLGAAEVSNSFISYLNPVASVVLLVNKSRYFFGCLLLQLQLLGFFFSDETAPAQTKEAKFYSVPNHHWWQEEKKPPPERRIVPRAGFEHLQNPFSLLG